MRPKVQAAQNLQMATAVGSLVTQILSQWYSSEPDLFPHMRGKCTGNVWNDLQKKHVLLLLREQWMMWHTA
jgi:hypothetical protein